MSLRVLEASAVAAAGTGAAGLVIGSDVLPILSIALTLLMFYVGRRDILERSSARAAQLEEKVARLEAEVSEARGALRDHARRLATAESEIHHRPTLSEMHVVMGRRRS